MSGEHISHVSLSKFHPLLNLCCECNSLLCSNINHQIINSESTSYMPDKIAPCISSDTSKSTDYSSSSYLLNHTTAIETSTSSNHQTKNFDETVKPPLPENTGIHTGENSFQNKFKFDHRGIHIANINIRHLKPKVDQIKIMLQESNIDILGTCETFLSKTDDDTIVNINGFTIERKDRDSCPDIETNKGGGIFIYLRDKLEYIRRHDLESPDLESIWIEIKIKHTKSFLVCSVYRPPSSTADWSDIFSSQIERSLASNNEIYLMGDFNIDNKEGKLINTKWKHVIEINDLHQLIDKPTRVTAHSETIIDHLYTSSPELVKDIFIPTIAVSDHYPIQFTRVTSKSHIKRQQHTTIHYRSFNRFNEEQFLSDMSDDLSSLDISSNDSDQNFNSFIASFISVFDKHAPLKTKRVRKETQPEWYDEKIKTASKTRDMHHKARNWNQYKYWRNKTTDLIRPAKKNFFARSIAENKDNTYLWKHIKNLNGHLNEKDIPDEMILDGQPTTDTLSILEKLNQFFSTISERLQAEQPQDSPEFDSTYLDNYIKTKIPNHIQFSISFMKLTDLITCMNSLDVTKATGLDGLTPKILKKSAEVVAPTLLKIINISFINGQFPETLKKAKLNPIHKGVQNLTHQITARFQYFQFYQKL